MMMTTKIEATDYMNPGVQTGRNINSIDQDCLLESIETKQPKLVVKIVLATPKQFKTTPYYSNFNRAKILAKFKRLVKLALLDSKLNKYGTTQLNLKEISRKSLESQLFLRNLKHFSTSAKLKVENVKNFSKLLETQLSGNQILNCYYTNYSLFTKVNSKLDVNKLLSISNKAWNQLSVAFHVLYDFPPIEWQADFSGLKTLASILDKKLPDSAEVTSFIEKMKGFSENLDDSLKAFYGLALVSLLGFSLKSFLTKPSTANGTMLAILGSYVIFNHGSLLTSLIDKAGEAGSRFMNAIIDCIGKIGEKLTSSGNANTSQEVPTSFVSYQADDSNETLESFFTKDSETASEWLEVISQLISIGVVSVLGMQCKPSSFHSVLRVSESLPKFLTNIVQTFSNLCDLSFKTKLQNIFKFGVDGNPDVQDFDTTVLNIIRARNDGELQMTIENLEFVSNTIDEGDKIFKRIPVGRDYDSVKKLIYDRTNDLRRIEKEFRQFNIHQNGFRQEPVGLLLKGGPGVFKSTMLEHFSAAANAISLGEKEFDMYIKDPHLFTFNRQFENVYWDAYTHHVNVVTIDDFGQAKDVAGTPDNEIMNVIRMSNSYQMDLHMAELSKKGSMKMQAKFLLATTNLIEIKPISIHSAKALTRRFPLQFIVVPKPKYCVDPSVDLFEQAVDISKIPKGLGGESNPLPEHFDFIVVDIATGKATKAPKSRRLSFDEVVTLMHKAYEQRKIWKKQHVESFNKTMNEVRTRFKPPSKEVEAQGLFDFISLSSSSDNSTTPGSFPSYTRTLSSKEEKIIDLIRSHTQSDFEYNHFTQLYEQYVRECSRNDRDWLLDLLESKFKHQPIHTELWYHFSMFKYSRNSYEDFVNGNLEDVKPIIDVPYFSPVIPFDCAMSLDEELFQTAWQSMKTNLCGKAMNFLAFLKENYVSAILITTLFSGLVYQFTRSKESDTIVEDQMDYTHTSRAKDRPKKMSLRDAKAKWGVEGQNADLQGYNIMKSVVDRNIGSFVVQDEKGPPHVLGKCTVLKTGCVLYPTHYLSFIGNAMDIGALQPACDIKILDSNGKSMACCKFYELLKNTWEDGLEEADMLLSRFKNARDSRDISKMFVSDAHIKFLPRIFAVSVQLPPTAAAPERVYYSSHSLLTTLNMKDVVVNKAIQYTADTGKGDCGVPIFFRSPQGGNERILGFHVAGTPIGKGSYAYAGLVSQETINIALAAASVYDAEEELSVLDVTPQGLPIHLEEKFRILGFSVRSHTPYGRNDLRPTVLQTSNALEKTTKFPALLVPRKGIDPFEQALKKYCINGAPVDLNIFKLATDDYKAYLNSFSIKKYAQLLTPGQAIWGFPEIGLDSIKTKTSMGYPLKWDDPQLKQRLLGENAVRNETNTSYDSMVRKTEEVIVKASKGERMLWLFTDNMKCELRSEAKVQSGNTRLFNGAPFIYFVVFRMYFGAFMTFMFRLSDAGKGGMAITINPTSKEWDFLAKNLAKFSTSNRNPLVGAGDFKGFDGSEMTIFHEWMLHYINEWYDDGPVNARIRETLWKEVTNSRHIAENVVYAWHSSLPSGHPMTIIINCMYNHLAFRMCWYQIPACQGKIFDKHVQLYVVGDDNIFSVHPQYRDVFNELALPALMGSIGLTYTTELKGSATIPFRNLEEVSFLKRTFRWETQLACYVGPHDYESLHNMIMWTKYENSEAVFVERLENYVRELCLYDEKFFNKKQKKLVRALEELAPAISEQADIHQNRSHYLNNVYDYIPASFTL